MLGSSSYGKTETCRCNKTESAEVRDEVFDMISLWSHKKLVETIQVTEMRSEQYISLAAEKIHPTLGVHGFVTRMGVGCKLPTCTHKLIDSIIFFDNITSYFLIKIKVGSYVHVG